MQYCWPGGVWPLPFPASAGAKTTMVSKTARIAVLTTRWIALLKSLVPFLLYFWANPSGLLLLESTVEGASLSWLLAAEPKSTDAISPIFRSQARKGVGNRSSAGSSSPRSAREATAQRECTKSGKKLAPPYIMTP